MTNGQSQQEKNPKLSSHTLKSPADLKILTPEEQLWTNVKENLTNQVKAAEDIIKVNKEFLKVVELHL